MAHLLEHMLFRARRKLNDIGKLLSNRAEITTARLLRPHQLLRDDAATDDNLK